LGPDGIASDRRRRAGPPPRKRRKRDWALLLCANATIIQRRMGEEALMVQPIRSIKDPAVIAARRSLGHFRPAEATSFLIEGAKLVLQALEAQAPVARPAEQAATAAESLAVDALFFLHPIQTADEEKSLQLARQAGVPCHVVTRGVFSRVLGLGYETATRVLGTVRITPLPLSELVGKAVQSGWLLIGERIQDPRNTGGLIRTAEAWGVRLVAFTTSGPTGVRPQPARVGAPRPRGVPERARASGGAAVASPADPYSRASVRSSTGSIFRVAVSTGSSTADLLAALKKAGIRVIGTSAGGQIPLWLADMSPPCAVLLGNETVGLSQEARQLSDVVVRIPMLGAAHSFNVTVAAGIVLYEAARQKALART
jgi:tRNA G18 (ribose-2'-O)-methylase SpoU